MKREHRFRWAWAHFQNSHRNPDLIISISTGQGQGRGRRWKLVCFPEDALHDVFPSAFWPHWHLGGNSGLGVWSPWGSRRGQCFLSRVTGRNTIITALSSAEVTKPDWGAGSPGSAGHLYHDAGSSLATCDLFNVLFISALHNLT